MKIVYLKPRRSSLMTELRSDTLWGLIITALARIYPETVVQEIIDSYEGEKQSFQVSSAFPFQQDTQGLKSYFFPKPLLHADFDMETCQGKQAGLERLQHMKAFRGVRYVSKKVFQQFLCGALTDSDLFDKTKDEPTGFSFHGIQESTIQHNTIDRQTWTTLEVNEKGQLYTSREQFFNKEYGLFFLVRGEQTDYVDSALRLLQHTGFGGGISVGKGVFDVEVEDFSLREPETADRVITLSLYSPTADELSRFGSAREHMSYDLEFRKGSVGRNISRRHEKDGVLMFREGSVFPSLSRERYGNLIKVRNRGGDLGHDIYHNGMSFHLNLRTPVS